MAVARTRPFICPDSRSVEVSPWIKTGDNLHLDDGMLLPTWDPATQITIVRMVQVNVGLMTETARLAPGTRMAILPVWWSPGTGLRGKGTGVNFIAEPTGKRQFDISMLLPGEQLKDSVQVKTCVVLLESPVRTK